MSLRPSKVYLTRMPKGPRCHDGQWRTASMSKITKGLRKQAKKEKKAVKKARKEDKKVDTSSVPPKSPFAA